MSDPERSEIVLMLGRIDERTHNTRVDIENLRLALKELQVGIAALQQNGCSRGVEHNGKIADLESRLKSIEGLRGKLIAVVLAIGAGSVGAKEGASKLWDVFFGG